MKNFKTFLFLAFSLLFPLAQCSTRETYIIHVLPPENNLIKGLTDLLDYYTSFLPKLPVVNLADKSPLIYSYNNVFSGFAAQLTTKELAAMAKMTGFVRAYPNHIFSLSTTHSSEFMGLRLNGAFGPWASPRPNLGEGVVIGMIDTGYSPDHPSFRNDGMPPPPPKWKGSCNPQNLCNNKIVGAKSFTSSVGKGETTSVVDTDGHGTHTASTAAGAFVDNAQVLRQANGTASGMAPKAHLAIYRVCNDLCATADILAGIDAAVSDGVDVLSISVGPRNMMEMGEDPIAIAGLAAVRKGIFVSCSAGNQGPQRNFINNDAPWLLTVAAGTMDREIRSTVELGTGEAFNGQSLYQPNRQIKLPLIRSPDSTGFCTDEFVNAMDVRGKMVVCLDDGTGRVATGERLKAAGAAAFVLVNDETRAYTTNADPHVLPSAHVSHHDGVQILTYANTAGANATLTFHGTVIGARPSPVVAAFSSRGPSNSNQFIIKPDIVGPGVNVLAAWNANISPDSTNKPYYFNVLSGTSMAAPHLAGVAAMLKKAHPNWSPSAIKSAILTTSYLHDRDRNPILNELHEPAKFFHMGAGHVNPSKAMHPGLVYETNPSDYDSFLCGLGLDDSKISTITNKQVKCAQVGSTSQWDLNYPSIGVYLEKNSLDSVVVVKRTVTNVGKPKCNYSVMVDDLAIAYVDVEPKVLRFVRRGEKKSFNVRFRIKKGVSEGISESEGNLRWISGNRVVRSPVYVSTVKEHRDLGAM